MLKQFSFDYRVLRICRKNHVDMGVGVSVSVPHASLFCKMKSIVCDDDDQSVTPLFYFFAHKCAGYILSPDSLAYQKGGSKYTYYPGLHELSYLHPDNFIPDPAVLEKEGLKKDTLYFLLRFSALQAYHDKRHRGFTEAQAHELIHFLEPYGRVIITSEKKVNESLKKYYVKISPDQMHSLMAYATLFIGDSQTMAAEAGVLGVPSIRMNTFSGKISYLNELEQKYQLVYSFLPEQFTEVKDKIISLLANKNLREESQQLRQVMLSEKINTAKFLTDFFLNH
jgi:predicted glycosyltransferase